MTLDQAKNMIRDKIRFKENQIKVRKIHLEEGKFESITDLIGVEVKNLQKDIEFFKALLIELD
ncbi:MAG: hypothetical protein OEM18_06510 [Nitrosopumilus sp.]|nr:hypothetical protein [Nitrosopumilus sp.]MDH3501711.1 hypothetical protein [Nitrosopumilus sp.]